MSSIITTIFDFLTVLFDKFTPEKLKGYRSIVGLVGLAIVMALQHNAIGSKELMDALNIGFLAWTGLSLNAKGRE